VRVDRRERPALPRQGDERVCVAAAERPSGLRDTIPSGRAHDARRLGGQVLLAWEEPERLHRGLQGARFNAPALAAVRRRGWAQSVGEREPGVASVSAPVRGANGVWCRRLGLRPVERLTRQPGRLHAAAVLAAAASLTEVVQRSQT
jgi:DNA-binding IclR family transcriptional regulator